MFLPWKFTGYKKLKMTDKTILDVKVAILWDNAPCSTYMNQFLEEWVT
jgi:hypothetical protein